MVQSNVITLGPFSGGLNNKNDASSLQDNELTQLVNYEVREGGVLVSRPGITRNPWGVEWGTGGGGLTATQTSGYACNPLAVGRYKYAGGASMLYKEIEGGVYQERMNNAADAVVGLNAQRIQNLTPGNNRSICAVQYNDKMYFSNASNKAACGSVRVGFTDFSTIATMPLAENLFVHKERLFAVPGKNTTAATASQLNRIYFSPVLYDGGDWNLAENFINIGGGDGEFICNGIVYMGDILFFKDSSTWRFTYEADIAGGTLERINASVGTTGSRSVIMCNDRCYTFYNNNLYEIFNYQWRNLSENIDFDKRAIRATDRYVEDVSLGCLGDRIIVSYYGDTYVYSQTSGTWTMWETGYGGFGRMLPVRGSYLDNIDNDVLIAGYYKNTMYKANMVENSRIAQLFRVEDKIGPAGSVMAEFEPEENFECRFTTKVVDLGAGSAFKRLMWWGVDALVKSRVQSNATVIVNNAGFSWDDLESYSLDALEQATCDNMITVLPRVKNDVDLYAVSIGRRFIKFLKGLRFRQIQFDFKTVVDGTADTVPHKVYGLTLVIKGKGKMSDQVS